MDLASIVVVLFHAKFLYKVDILFEIHNDFFLLDCYCYCVPCNYYYRYHPCVVWSDYSYMGSLRCCREKVPTTSIRRVRAEG